MIDDTVSQLSAKWWTFLLRGLAALALAAFAFASPGTTATALAYVFAAYFLVSGVAALFAGISLTGAGSWWTLTLLGVVQCALGFMMLTEPGAGPLALAYLFAIWTISTGALELLFRCCAAQLHRQRVLVGSARHHHLGVRLLRDPASEPRLAGPRIHHRDLCGPRRHVVDRVLLSHQTRRQRSR